MQEQLVMNPCARLYPLRQGEGVAELLIEAAVRGQPRRFTTITPDHELGLFPLLARLIGAQGDVELELAEAQLEYLHRIGFLVLPEDVPRAVGFSSWLEPETVELLPMRARRSPEGGGSPGPEADWVVHPSFVYHVGADPPARWREQITGAGGVPGWHGDGPWVWIEDAATGLPCGYGVRGAVAELARELSPGQAAPHIEDLRLLAVLRCAEVLVPRRPLAERAATGQRQRRAAAESLKTHGYAVFTDLLPPLLLAALRRYYRSLMAEGFFPLGDDLVERRYVGHNEAVARFFHRLLAPLVTEIVGQPVKPSYVFFSSYLEGALLPRHIDREQCEWSISLQLDYTPEPAAATPWAIHLQPLAETAPATALQLALGDGLLYKGRELWHHRDPLPPGHRSTSLFLHYVPYDFAGKLD
jgi:hypothetical protein